MQTKKLKIEIIAMDDKEMIDELTQVLCSIENGMRQGSNTRHLPFHIFTVETEDTEADRVNYPAELGNVWRMAGLGKEGSGKP